jgi:hypothetical protein
MDYTLNHTSKLLYEGSYNEGHLRREPGTALEVAALRMIEGQAI